VTDKIFGPRLMARIRAAFGQSLGNRIFMTIVLVGTVLSAAFFGVHSLSQETEWSRLYENRGRMLSNILANLAKVGLYSESPELLKRSSDILLQNPNVLGVQFYLTDDRLLYEYSKNNDINMFTERPDWRTLSALKKDGKPMPVTDMESYSIFSAPVILERQQYTAEGLYLETVDQGMENEAVGYVLVSIDRTAFIRNVRKVLLQDIAISFIFIVAGGAIIFYFVRRFTRPVEALSVAVTKFGNVRSFEKLPVAGSDEVGRLTEAFNTMAETIMAREAERSRIESKLRHSLKMESVGTMAGGIAHDFRNILTAIIGFANILKLEMGKDNPSRQYIDHILATSARATKLIQGLLTYSRKQIMDPMPVNINRLISDLENIIKRIIRADIRLDLRLSGMDLIAIVDQGQIEQLLINLCTNARDAMPGGGTLGISTARRRLASDSFNGFGPLTTGYYAEIIVSDTGAGMDSETLKRIFDPFFTSKQVGDGTGLGLSIAYGIVKQHEGFIDVKSEPGKGTVFSIYLPLTEGPVRQTADTPDQSMPKGTETLLIAEDDEEVRFYIKDILGLFGYSVIAAGDGDEALRLFGEHPETRLLLLDMIMPGRNGIDVLRAARRTRPDIKAIFISGYPDDRGELKPLMDEKVELIIKPVAPEDLLGRVRRLLDQ